MAPTSRNPGGRTRITPAVRTQVEALARDGVGRNEITRITGVSQGSVFNICKAADPPILFDRAATKAATKAKQADLADVRTNLELAYALRAAKLEAQCDLPHLVFSFGGKDHEYAEHLMDSPTTGDIKNLMQSSSLANTASLRISVHNDGTGDDESRERLAAIDALIRGDDGGDHAPETEPDPGPVGD